MARRALCCQRSVMDTNARDLFLSLMGRTNYKADLRAAPG